MIRTSTQLFALCCATTLVSAEGDPRYLGYAQAALRPWWEMPMPPVEVQVLRASLRQFRHDFAGAVRDLDQVLQREPQHRQALAQRAIIHIVQARYVQARSDCRTLQKAGGKLIGIGCEAMVDGLTGKAATAYQVLNNAVSGSAGVSAGDMLWLQTRLAELAQRFERNDAAEAHFKQALALGISDTYLLAAYSDFLLAQRRPAEVVTLLKNKSRSDVLLLRLVFAERTLQLLTAKEYELALVARYAAAHGDCVSRRIAGVPWITCKRAIRCFLISILNTRDYCVSTTKVNPVPRSSVRRTRRNSFV